MWWLWFYLEFGISAACLMIKLCKIVTEPLLKMEFWMVGLVWWSVSGPLRPGGALWCKLARFRESENGKRHQGEILTQTSKHVRTIWKKGLFSAKYVWTFDKWSTTLLCFWLHETKGGEEEQVSQSETISQTARSERSLVLFVYNAR